MGSRAALICFTFIPEISFTQTAPLTVTAKAILNTATELAWDFGDGTPTLASAEGTHVYTKPGRYDIRMRCVANDVLSDYRLSVVVSRNHKLGDPLIVYPSILFDINTKTITGTAVGAVPETSRILSERRQGNCRRQQRKLHAETGLLYPGLCGCAKTEFQGLRYPALSPWGSGSSAARSQRHYQSHF